MKRYRLPLIILGVLLAVILVVPQLFTLNNFKELAAQKVEQATGRKLDIAGDIRLSFFPLIGAEVEQVSLSNLPGAEHPSMFSVEKAKVGVKLIPLLTGKVELGRIVLEEPMIYLEKNEAGVANWEFPKQPEPEPTPGAKRRKHEMSLGGLTIKRGAITYHDGQKGTAVELSNVDLEADVPDMDSPAALDVSATWQGLPVRANFKTESLASLMADVGSQTEATVKAYGIGGELKAIASFTPARAVLRELELDVAGIKAEGELSAALSGAVPNVNATLAFDKVNLKPLMALGAAAASSSGGEGAAKKPQGASGGGLLAADAFKAVDGVFNLAATEVTGDGFVLAAPKAKLQLAGGNATLEAQGVLTQDGQEPISFSAASSQLQQVLSGAGGGFEAKAKRGAMNVAASGNLGLGPKKVNWQNAHLKVNDQTMQGRVLANFGGAKPKLDAALSFDVLDVEKLKALAGAASGAGGGSGGAKAEKAAAADLSMIQKMDVSLDVKAGMLVAAGQRVEGFALKADTGSGSLNAAASGTWLKDAERWQFSAGSPKAEQILSNNGGPFEAKLAAKGQSLGLSGTLAYSPDAVVLDPVTVVTNGGEGKGALRYENDGGKPSVEADMKFDSLDLNPLLALAGDGKDKPKPAAASGTAAAKQGSPLDTLDAKIRFKANRLKVKEIVATDAALNADVKNGNLALEVPGVGLYGGKASLKADVKGEAFTGVLKGEKVDMGALLKGGSGTSAFQGIADFDIDVAGTGLEAPAMYRTMNGKGDFAIKDMVISGMDILTLATQVRSLKSDSIAKGGSNKMDAKGTFVMTNGVAKNDDMEATGPNVQMKGAGEVNLPAWTINFRLDPKLGETRKNAAGEEKFVGTTVPILIDGSLDKPRVYPDPKALIKTGLESLGTIKELGIGDKVKGVEKYLNPLLGVPAEEPKQQPAPAAPAPAPAETAPAPAAQPEAAPAEQKQPNPVEQIQQLQQLFKR